MRGGTLQSKRTPSTSVALVAAGLVSAYGAVAGATGIAVARFGGEHGNPMASNPTAMYYNPAGLALGIGTRLLLEGSFALRMFTYDRAPGAIDHPNTMPGTPDVGVNSGEGSVSNLIISPFVGVATDLGVPNLGLGLGFYTPFGGQTEWDQNEAYAGNTMYPGAVDGPQRWHNINGSIRSSYITAAGAYKLPFGLSVGVGVNVVMSVVNTIRASNTDGTDDVVMGNGGLQEGRALLDVSGTTVSIGAGVAYAPSDGLVIGLSYQSQPGFGEMTLEGTLRTKLGASPVSDSEVELLENMADIIRAGVAVRPTTAIELRLWGSYERWSVLERQCIINATVQNRGCDLDARGRPTRGDAGVLNNIPRDWKDSFGVRASGSYFVSPTLELMLGVGYDGNAVPDSTIEASLPDQSDVTATVGAVLGLLDGRMQLSLNFLNVISLSRTVHPRARMGDEPVVPFEAPSRVPDGAGTYSQYVGVLQVGVGYRF
jgi:long-chain fatty acid transport protein